MEKNKKDKPKTKFNQVNQHVQIVDLMNIFFICHVDLEVHFLYKITRPP